MTDDSETLYDVLGGHDGVAAVVDETDLENLKRMQTAFIAAVVDGPPQHSGAELNQIHRNRGIERRHFSKFCGHMLDSLHHHGVAPNLVDQVLSRLAMFSDKVTGSANVDG
jgi:hemoglobin